MDWASSRGPWLIVCLLGLALLVRLAAAFVVQRMLPPGQICLIAGDAEGYWDLGRTIAGGQDYQIHDPPRFVLRMPGFPVVLAGCQRLFGERTLAARIVLAFIGATACGLVYWLGRELFDHSVGLVALALAAFWPTFVLFSVLILSETLFAATLLASLIATTRLMRQVSAGEKSRKTAIAGTVTGLLIGLATLVRPTWLLAGPAVAIATMVASRRRAWLATVLVLTGLAAALAPWTIRNGVVTGHFVTTTLWVGPSLYDGLNPHADGSSHMEFVEREGVYRRMSEYDADQFYRNAAGEFVRQNPGRSLQLALIKLGRYFNPCPNAAQFQHPVAAGGLAVLFVAMIGLALYAAWQFRHDVWSWAIPLLPLLFFAAIHTVFVGSLRYRLPAEYPLLILTASGLLAALRRPPLSPKS